MDNNKKKIIEYFVKQTLLQQHCGDSIESVIAQVGTYFSKVKDANIDPDEAESYARFYLESF